MHRFDPIQEVVHCRRALFLLFLIEEELQCAIGEITEAAAWNHTVKFRHSLGRKLLFKVNHVRDDLVAEDALGQGEPESAKVLQPSNHSGHA